MPGNLQVSFEAGHLGSSTETRYVSNSSLPWLKQKSLLWFILSNNWSFQERSIQTRGWVNVRSGLWHLRLRVPFILPQPILTVATFLIIQDTITQGRFGILALELPWKFHICVCHCSVKYSKAISWPLTCKAQRYISRQCCHNSHATIWAIGPLRDLWTKTSSCVNKVGLLDEQDG